MKGKRQESLFAAALENRLDAADRTALNELLRGSAEARAEWVGLARVHGLLHRVGEAGGEISSAAIIHKYPRHQLIGLAVAAAVALAVFLMFPQSGGERGFVTLETRAARWDGDGPGDGALAGHVPYTLKSGFALLRFSSGVEVTLEGPCTFSASGPLAMRVDHGSASIRTPEHVSRFTVSTPGGDFVDMGTEFGIAVGSDGSSPVILTDVFSGEIEVRPPDRDPQRLKQGQAGALLVNGPSHLVSSLNHEPVGLSRMRRGLPTGILPTDPGENLALGKPVFAPAYLTRPHGSVFPPDNLTDGRLDDSGVPGDWSFWLAPNGEAGEFTVDLLEPHTISRIELQNTRNRHIGDRGLKRFLLLVSTDNREFVPVLEGGLEAIPADVFPFPVETFTFAPVRARYVKILGMEHYRSALRPVDHEHQGGGLNEIRVFAE